MSTVEILRAAKARIDTPEKWWQLRDGRPQVNRECALVALAIVADQDFCHPAFSAVTRVMEVSEPSFIPRFNDSHTHAEVMAAFDRAIAAEEAREQEFNVTPLSELVAA